MTAPDPALVETLDHLEMPRVGIAIWMRNLRAFCEKHGGKTDYGELLSLVDECEQILEGPACGTTDSSS